MKVGAFVCSCGGSNAIDLEGVREGVEDVEVVASSSHLCEDGLPAMGELVDEYGLDQLVVTASERGCQEKIRALADEKGLHPEATAFVDHREGAGWVHDEGEATDKTARLINATTTGLEHEAPSRTVSKEAGDHVLVVGDPEAADSLSETADVTLVADGREFLDTEYDLEDVRVERGHVVDVDGSFGEFEITLQAHVTEDCIGCMDCVREAPDGKATSYPVDLAYDVDPSIEECCPVDAIDMDGVSRTITADQIVYPAGPSRATGGQQGYYTHFDGGVAAAVESLLGGISKPKHLELDMDVCASGGSSQQGCTQCTDACPHEAVARPAPDEVEFDETACMDCGACTSSCPTGAVQLREPSNERIARETETLFSGGPEEQGRLSQFLGSGSSGINDPILAFVCSESAADALRSYGRRAGRGEDITYPPILPVRVNCTDTVGEAHVLHALASGAAGVAIVGCGGSCLHSGPDPKTELVERLNTATSDLGLGKRVEFFAPEKGDPEAFVEELSSFAELTLDESPIPAGEHEATGTGRPESDRDPFTTHDWALESVRSILEHVEPERDVIRGLQSFGRMSVSDDCNLTPTCTTLCPTDAISREDADLRYNHADCVNCGLCETGCPENAITMESGLELSRLPENRDGEEWETVFEGEMQECVRCGTPFTSVGSKEKVQEEVGDLVQGVAGDTEHSIFEYCDQCRAAMLFES